MVFAPVSSTASDFEHRALDTEFREQLGECCVAPGPVLSPLSTGQLARHVGFPLECGMKHPNIPADRQIWFETDEESAERRRRYAEENALGTA